MFLVTVRTFGLTKKKKKKKKKMAAAIRMQSHPPKYVHFTDEGMFRYYCWK